MNIECQSSKLINLKAPLQEVVEYEEVDFVNPFAHDTIYRGPPTPELEDAWADLWFCKSSFPNGESPQRADKEQTMAFVSPKIK